MCKPIKQLSFDLFTSLDLTKLSALKRHSLNLQNSGRYSALH